MEIHSHQVQWQYYVYWFCEWQRAQLGGRMVSNELCEGDQSQAYIIKHPISTQLTPMWWNTLTSVQWTFLRVLILWVPELENWGTDGLQMIVGEKQSACLIIKHPISNTMTPCDGIHWIRYQWHYYVYWFCEVPGHNWGRMFYQMNCVRGEQSHAYIIKHPIEHNDSLWWNTLTSGTGTLLLYWFCECQSRPHLEDGWSSNELCEGERLCLHNSSTQSSHITPGWIPHIRYSDHTTCMIRGPEQHTWRTDGLQMNCVRESVSCLHNQAPNWKHNDSLWWNTLIIRYSDITTCIDLWVPEAATTEDRWSPMNGVRIAVSCLHNQSTHWNTIDSCDEYTTIRYSDITTVLFCSARAAQLGTDGLQRNCVVESSLMLT